MTDWQIYWADFDKQREDDWPPDELTSRPFDWWRTNNARLIDNLSNGEHRLWLFTSGKLCGRMNAPAIHQAYWALTFRVLRCDENPDYGDPGEPTCDWRYRIWVHDDGCLAIDPPILVEDIVFPAPGRTLPPIRGQTVGEKLQTPRTLDGRAKRLLQDRLRQERELSVPD